MSSCAPAPTAPDADSSEVKSLEALIEEASNIATTNQAIIAEIRGAEKYQVLRCYVEAKSREPALQFDVEEVAETLDYEALCQIWRVAPQNKLTAITPDLFKDGINYDCNTMDDVITLNEQMLECCKKYWFLDQKKASPFILKFIKNFELLQASLESVRDSYLKPRSQLEEVRERVSSINSAIVELSALPMVSFACRTKFAGGTILDDKMRTTLSKLFAKNQRFAFLASSDSIGISAAAFDNAVRGKGPFAVIIRSTSGHVFGVYVPEEFSAKSGHLPCSPDQFLFALGNMTGSPLKFLPIQGSATMHFGSCGLHVGQSNELVCFCSHQCGELSGGWTAAPGYPATFSAGTLCGTPGNQSFAPQLMEIFIHASG
jgi:hypothetical protein